MKIQYDENTKYNTMKIQNAVQWKFKTQYNKNNVQPECLKALSAWSPPE